ncbi:hypothetical protein PMAYCL1PPCAC_00392, partial [Pristionchus mayeri]
QLYSSPEQSGCITFSSKTDVFALGIIFVELGVVMDYSKLFHRAEIFDSYRRGELTNDLFKDDQTVKFVAKLAARYSKDRPTREEILRDPYLVLGL